MEDVALALPCVSPKAFRSKPSLVTRVIRIMLMIMTETTTVDIIKYNQQKSVQKLLIRMVRKRKDY